MSMIFVRPGGTRRQRTDKMKNVLDRLMRSGVDHSVERRAKGRDYFINLHGPVEEQTDALEGMIGELDADDTWATYNPRIQALLKERGRTFYWNVTPPLKDLMDDDD